MPKIAYDFGLNPQQAVTKEWIQEKLNAAKALMQGRIDEENLCADNPEQLMKTIKDRPTEVVAYDNCMKFFQERDGSIDLGGKTPYEDLFWELVNLCKASPDVAVVGGTLDSEIVSTYSIEDLNTESDTQTSYIDVIQKDLEVPPNYFPMTWNELADLMVANKFELQEIVIDENSGKLSLSKIDSSSMSAEEKKKYICDKILGVSQTDYAASVGFTVEWSASKTNVNYYEKDNDKSKDTFGADVYAPVLCPEFDFSTNEFNSEKNTFEVYSNITFFKSLAKQGSEFEETGDFKYTKSSGATTIRFIPEFLCKVV